MITRSITASALAGGLLMMMMQAPAQALPGVKSDIAQPSAVTLATKKGHKGGHHRGHHRFRSFGFYGFPYYYGYNSYFGSYGRCDWLHRRAFRTGSAYWWNRYYACRDGYY